MYHRLQDAIVEEFMFVPSLGARCATTQVVSPSQTIGLPVVEVRKISECGCTHTYTPYAPGTGNRVIGPVYVPYTLRVEKHARASETRQKNGKPVQLIKLVMHHTSLYKIISPRPHGCHQKWQYLGQYRPTSGPYSAFWVKKGRMFPKVALFQTPLSLGLFQKLSSGGAHFFRPLHPQDTHGVRGPRPPGHVSVLINLAPLWIKYALTPRTSYSPSPTPRTHCQQNTPPQDKKKVPAAHPPPENNFWNSPYACEHRGAGGSGDMLPREFCNYRPQKSTFPAFHLESEF